MSRQLTLFDVDGTLTRRDTMFLFLLHALGPLGVASALVRAGPTLVLHLLRIVDNATAKDTLLRTALSPLPRPSLEAAASSFADRVDRELRPGALDRVRAHVAQGDEVLLVSASLDLWLAPWAERHALRLLATPAGYDGDRFTGLGGPNNHGPQKVVRVREVVDPAGFSRVCGYGDSSGDTEMLALCSEVHFRPFRG